MINNTYKPNSALFAPKASFKSLSGMSNGLVSLPSSKTTHPKQPGSVTGEVPKPAKQIQPATNITKTASGGTIESINGGKAYSNPLDNPNFKPATPSQPLVQPVQPAAQPASQPVPQTQSKAPEPVKGLLSTFLTKGQEQLAEAAKVGGEAGNLRARIQKETQNVMGNRNYSGSVKIGQAANIQQNLGTQLQGLTAQQQALQGTGQSYISAAGLASPVQVSYSSQFIDPTTGLPVSGTGSASLNDAVANVAEKVRNGSMSYDQGVQALSGYGQGGVNALQSALGSGFDIVGSNAKAQASAANIQQTGTTGGQMQKSAQAANQALDTLQSAYNSLGSFSGGSNVPFLNQLTQNLALQTGVGREAVSAYQGALKEARAQINTVLAPLVGVESANATSNSLLPDNMIPSEIPQKIAAAKEYIQQRVSAFTQAQPLGTQPTSSTGSTAFAEQW